MPDSSVHIRPRLISTSVRYRTRQRLRKCCQQSTENIVKAFLHLSREEQRKGFLGRIDEADRNWKFSDADVVERKFRDDYMRAYGRCLSATSTEASPWYIVPADDKDSTRLIASWIVLDAFAGLNMSYPVVSAARRRELKSFRKQLAQ